MTRAVPLNPYVACWKIDDRAGSHGATNTHVKLMRLMAGQSCIDGGKETDPRLKQNYRERERAYDEIASILATLAPPPICAKCGKEYVGTPPDPCRCLDAPDDETGERATTPTESAEPSV